MQTKWGTVQNSVAQAVLIYEHEDICRCCSHLKSHSNIKRNEKVTNVVEKNEIRSVHSNRKHVKIVTYTRNFQLIYLHYDEPSEKNVNTVRLFLRII